MSTTATSIAFIFLHFRSAEIKWLGCWKFLVITFYNILHFCTFNGLLRKLSIEFRYYMEEVFLAKIPIQWFLIKKNPKHPLIFGRTVLTKIWKTNHRLSIESSVCSVCLPILSLRTIPSGSVTLIKININSIRLSLYIPIIAGMT